VVDWNERMLAFRGKNYEKALLPAFSKIEFFLGRALSLLGASSACGVKMIQPYGSFYLGLTCPAAPAGL